MYIYIVIAIFLNNCTIPKNVIFPSCTKRKKNKKIAEKSTRESTK